MDIHAGTIAEVADGGSTEHDQVLACIDAFVRAAHPQLMGAEDLRHTLPCLVAIP